MGWNQTRTQEIFCPLDLSPETDSKLIMFAVPHWINSCLVLEIPDSRKYACFTFLDWGLTEGEMIL